MAAHLDLDGSDFRALSREEQIARCHEMVREAYRMANTANADKRIEYIDLASRWADLAREMEDSR